MGLGMFITGFLWIGTLGFTFCTILLLVAESNITGDVIPTNPKKAVTRTTRRTNMDGMWNGVTMRSVWPSASKGHTTSDTGFRAT